MHMKIDNSFNKFSLKSFLPYRLHCLLILKVNNVFILKKVHTIGKSGCSTFYFMVLDPIEVLATSICLQ